MEFSRLGRNLSRYILGYNHESIRKIISRYILGYNHDSIRKIIGEKKDTHFYYSFF